MRTLQFILVLLILACLLIESPDITWFEVIARVGVIAGSGVGIGRLEEKKKPASKGITGKLEVR